MKKLLQSDAFKNFGSSAIAILIGLLIGAVVIFISNSSEALDGLRTLLAGPVEDGMLGIGRVLYYAVPIIMTGLSVGFAFKTGLFNIGTPGQFIIGAFAAVYVGVKWTFLPGSIHWLVAILAAFAAGGLLGSHTGSHEGLFEVNEVISSIMMNYIGHVSWVNLIPSVWCCLTHCAISPCRSLPRVIPKWALIRFYRFAGKRRLCYRHTVRYPDIYYIE